MQKSWTPEECLKGDKYAQIQQSRTKLGGEARLQAELLLTNCMCSFSYSRLEDWLRVYLLSCLSFLDEATKGAITINVLLFFPIQSTPGSVLLSSFWVSSLFSQTRSY
ncbi:hypothetical protein GOODEAATRI_016314 [Goodea atripinnis]|uniref:Uncharacterized protein n=1 Tax=Goodea atripinnis TaxID=208336 RepID=A0ABV0NYF0_9TELE